MHFSQDARKNLRWTAAANPEAKFWRQRGALLEAIVNDQIDSSDWFGESAIVIVPSRFDDVVNGVDSIVEFEEGIDHSYLALAIDVTKSGEHLTKKFDKIRTSIEKGELSRVKYFESRGVQKELLPIPRVVVGADQKTMEEVATLLLAFKTHQRHPALKSESSAGQEAAEEKKKDFRRIREELAEHKLQFQLLFQIKIQLEAFWRYAKKTGKEKPAETHERLLETVNGIIEVKADTQNFSEIESAINEDGVHRMIIEKARGFGG